MTAAQMLSAAGESNTPQGRANFHKKFPNKDAFDQWYDSKKEYGGMTNEIAFPQQPRASFAYGGASEEEFFAPNYMPYNGPTSFYEQGGLTDGIAFPQQPTDHINFSAFPWQPKYAMGGLPMGANNEPCYECGGNYMQPGGPVGNKPAPNPDTYFNEQDAALDYPAQGTNTQYDYSKVTNQGPAFSQYSTAELNNMGANIPVPNPTQDARFAKIAEYNKEHPYIPAGGNLFKKSDNSPGKFQYNSGKYMPFPAVTNQPVVNNRYGGYMQTGGSSVDGQEQNDLVQNRASEFMNSLNQYNQLSQPIQMNPAEEAGSEQYSAAYGTEVNYNQMEDFNAPNMHNVEQRYKLDQQIQNLNNQGGFGQFFNALGNLGQSAHAGKTKTKMRKMSGYSNQQPQQQPVQQPAAGTSNNWAATRSNMAGQEAANNLFKQYGGDFFQTGGNNVNYQNRVQDILMKGQPHLNFTVNSKEAAKQNQERASRNAWIDSQMKDSYKGNAAQAAVNTQQYTPEQLAAFQAYMQKMQGQQTQGAYAPNWQALMNTGSQGQNSNDLIGKLAHFKNRNNIFGNKLVMDFKYYDPRTGTTQTLPGSGSSSTSGTSSTSGSSSRSGKSDQQNQKGPKGSGFLKNLIAKSKQRKAEKQKQIPLTQQEKEMRPDYNPQKQKTLEEVAAEQAQLDYERSADKQWNENMQNSDVYDPQLQQEADAFWNQNLQNAAQAKRNYGKTLPDPSNFSSYAPTNNRPMVNPINNPAHFPTWQSQNLQKAPYTPGSAGPGFAYGGFPEYEEGGIYELDDDQIANILAMGGTIDYVD
jgi:hypothetical protein